MTVERAGQHLMQLTLGESVFLNEDNISKIVEDVEKILIEKQQLEFEGKQLELKQENERQQAESAAILQKKNAEILEAQSETFLAKESSKLSEARNTILTNKLQLEAARLQEIERVDLQGIVKITFYIYSIIQFFIALLIGTLVWIFTYISMDAAYAKYVTYFATAAAILSFIGYFKIPEMIFFYSSSKIKTIIFNWIHSLIGSKADPKRFQINWNSRVVTCITNHSPNE